MERQDSIINKGKTTSNDKSIRSFSFAIIMLFSLGGSDSNNLSTKTDEFNYSTSSDDIVCLKGNCKNGVFENILGKHYLPTNDEIVPLISQNTIPGRLNNVKFGTYSNQCKININFASVLDDNHSNYLDHQEFLDEISDDLYNYFKILLLGFLGWWATGVDDLVIFAGLYFFANRIKEKLSVFGGFSLSVAVMISICLIYDLIVDSFEDLQILKFIMRIVPILLGGKVIKDEYFDKEKNENIEEYNGGHSLNMLFIAAFMGYFLNSSDDIFYNVGVISNIDDTGAYFLGNALGAVSMVSIPIVLNKYLEYKEKNKKSNDISIKKNLSDVLNIDQPRLRAVAMIGVGVYLGYIAMQDVDILFEFFDGVIS